MPSWHVFSSLSACHPNTLAEEPRAGQAWVLHTEPCVWQTLSVPIVSVGKG